MLYHDAALRRDRHQRAGFFDDMRTAFGADPQGFKQHLKKLITD